jgi:heme-degrading monooxygenase HmoA
MHARTGSFQLSPDKLDEAVNAFESNDLPQYKDQNGYKGFTLLVNRQNGKMIGVSFWENESDIAASDELGSAARNRIQQIAGGESPMAHTKPRWRARRRCPEPVSPSSVTWSSSRSGPTCSSARSPANPALSPPRSSPAA